jgi:hypothetical protein
MNQLYSWSLMRLLACLLLRLVAYDQPVSYSTHPLAPVTSQLGSLAAISLRPLATSLSSVPYYSNLSHSSFSISPSRRKIQSLKSRIGLK